MKENTKIQELNFQDHKVGLYRGKNDEFIVTQEYFETKEVQKIVLTEHEMMSLLKSLGMEMR